MALDLELFLSKCFVCNNPSCATVEGNFLSSLFSWLFMSHFTLYMDFYCTDYNITKYNISIYSPQVILEAVAGVTSASNIAIDDFNFSTNLTCFSVGRPTPPEIFEGNDSRGRRNSCNVL